MSQEQMFATADIGLFGPFATPDEALDDLAAMYEPESHTYWVRLSCWPVDEAGHPLGPQSTRSLTVHPREPECTAPAHQWRPYAVVGGLEENPGVVGHGGGVIIKEVCDHCQTQRITDTWAQDPETGEQGLVSLCYREAEES